MGNSKTFWKRKTMGSRRIKFLIPAVDQKFYEARILNLNKKLLDIRASNNDLLIKTQELADKNKLLIEEK